MSICLSASLKELCITEAQWQDRLARYWRLMAEVNADAIALVSEALFSWDERWLVGDVRQQERQDVEYLRRCLRAGKLYAELLSEYHRFLASVSGPKAEARTRLDSSRRRHEELTHFLSSEFSFDFVDPLGGDQATWLDALHRLLVFYFEGRRAIMPSSGIQGHSTQHWGKSWRQSPARRAMTFSRAPPWMT